MGAAVPPGYPGVGGSVSTFAISPRLTRIMIAFSFHALSPATLQSIYCNLFQTWLEDFPAYSLSHHHQLAKVGRDYSQCNNRTSYSSYRMAKGHFFSLLHILSFSLPFLSAERFEKVGKES